MLLSITIALHLIVGILGVTIGVDEHRLYLLLGCADGDAGLCLSEVVPDHRLIGAEVLHFEGISLVISVGEREEDLVVLRKIGQRLIDRLALSILEFEEQCKESAALMSLEVRHRLELVLPDDRYFPASFITKSEALLLWIEESLADIVAMEIAMSVVVSFLDEYITGRPIEALCLRSRRGCRCRCGRRLWCVWLVVLRATGD